MTTVVRDLALLVFLSAVFIVIPSASAETSHLLDGKSFVGKNGEKDRPLDPDEDEEITFQNGLFTSISCEPYNFGSAKYSATLVGAKVHFEAVTHSPTHGQIEWRGVVDDDVAKMTFIWTKKRWYWDIRREYWFEGVLKK